MSRDRCYQCTVLRYHMSLSHTISVVYVEMQRVLGSPCGISGKSIHSSFKKTVLFFLYRMVGLFEGNLR